MGGLAAGAGGVTRVTISTGKTKVEKMDGYYSLDGGAVVKVRFATNHDIIDLWMHALMVADETAKTVYSVGACSYYYTVANFTRRAGSAYYRYKIDIFNDAEEWLYTVLIDPAGFGEVEIRYGAQRTNNALNLSYRDWFKFLGMRLLKEDVSRVDFALTIRCNPSFVIRHILDNKYTSLLSRKFITTIGDPADPSYVRIGSNHNVQVCVYDKHNEVLDNSHKVSYQLKLNDYMDKFGDEKDVTRIEYRLYRAYLRNVGLTSPDDINREIFQIWVTMLTRYFTPTDKVYDGYHKQDVAEWWTDLPPLGVKLKSGVKKQGPIMFNKITGQYYRVRTLVSREWYQHYRMMMDRTQGYIAAIAASIARCPENLDDAIQIVFRRLFKEGDIIYARASSKLALS